MLPDTIVDQVAETALDSIRKMLQETARRAQEQGFAVGESEGRGRVMIDADAARNELREIAVSFERDDMGDVRRRLMDLANILHDFNFWIPSR